MNINEIETRVAQISTEIEQDGADLEALSAELDQLEARKAEIVAEADKKAEIRNKIAAGEVAVTEKEVSEERKMSNTIEERAQSFVADKRMTIENGIEARQLLSTGNVANPTVVRGIEEIANTVGGIINDIFVENLTGVGTLRKAYKATNAAADDVTEGSEVAGTPGTFNYVDINPPEWGVLDEVSNLVAKKSPLDYMTAVQTNAVIGLRATAEKKVWAAVEASTIKGTSAYALDGNFLRNVLLNFVAIDGKGELKLYLNRHDLAALGQVVKETGKNEKLYTIAFDAGTTKEGTISENGLALRFGVTECLANGVQYFGQPLTVTMGQWGPYEVSTDEGGDYFKRNMIGVRGLQLGGAGLCAFHGMVKNTVA